MRFLCSDGSLDLVVPCIAFTGGALAACAREQAICIFLVFTLGTRELQVRKLCCLYRSTQTPPQRLVARIGDASRPGKYGISTCSSSKMAPDQRPRNHPLALEREHHGALYSPARALSRAAFLGDVATHARKESALGGEAARTQRRGDAAHVCRVARWCNGHRHSRDQTSDGKKTRRARCDSRYACCNFRCKWRDKSREIDRDSSPRIPGIWQ